jgi:outer membrane protein assembly factor BamE (lipoprotein component of BamABCDE complex)
MKKMILSLAVATAACTLIACSNIITYYRHDESKGNVQCSSDKALKRDSVCNAHAGTEQQKQ